MKCHICNQYIKDMDGSVVCHTACVALAELEAAKHEHIEKAKEILRGVERICSSHIAWNVSRNRIKEDIEKAFAELEAAESKPQKCRRCSECQYEEHHWIETCEEKSDEPIMICKHCPATKAYPDLIDQGDDTPEPDPDKCQYCGACRVVRTSGEWQFHCKCGDPEERPDKPAMLEAEGTIGRIFDKANAESKTPWYKELPSLALKSKPEPTELLIKEARIFFKTGRNMIGCVSWQSMAKLVEGLVRVGLETCDRLESQAEYIAHKDIAITNLRKKVQNQAEALRKQERKYLTIKGDLKVKAEQLAKMERMVEIPDLLKDGFLAVGQELIRRDMLIAVAKKEIERLKHGIKLYVILRDRKRFTPHDVLEKIGEFTGNKYEAGYLISSIRRDLEKALKEGE